MVQESRRIESARRGNDAPIYAVPNACPNLHDSSDDFSGGGFSFDPGESIAGRLTTIARYEATAVPEPNTPALFAAAGLGFLAVQRQRVTPRNPSPGISAGR
jgi:hypothetical protein